ncbi:MAG: hydrogenase expression/formation protein HypE, partial [Hyphomicrobiaceae bacterium]|nr:hydrogenase expression/formation protein HypE [Hyphomicrobiaceae bacterium]
GIFINTAGIGQIDHNQVIAPASVRKGDVILINGDLARHGMAIMAVREGLEFESAIKSDSAPVAEPVLRLLEEGVPVHCLRDLTRGGLASALNELAGKGEIGMQIDETLVPVREDVASACEILGFDPLYVANEGKCVAIAAAEAADAALEAMRSHSLGGEAALIGEVVEGPKGQVVMRSRIGGERIVDMMSGEQLPRIC